MKCNPYLFKFPHLEDKEVSMIKFPKFPFNIKFYDQFIAHKLLLNCSLITI